MSLNNFNYLIDLSNHIWDDIFLLKNVIDKLCAPSNSIYDLFNDKICIALNHGLITLTNYMQNIHNHQNIKLNSNDIISYRFKNNVFGFDFVDYQHPSHLKFEYLLEQNFELFIESYIKYCIFLNKLVIHAVLYQDYFKNQNSFSSLSTECQKHLLGLIDKITKSNLFFNVNYNNVFTMDDLSKFKHKDLIVFLEKLCLFKIDIPFNHFFHFIRKKNSNNEWELLLRYAIDLNVQDSLGTSLLMCAVQNGNSDCFKYLIQHNPNVNYKDKSGSTALMYATERGDLEIMVYLIQHNADLDTQKYNGSTALMIAADTGYVDCLKVLLDHSADIEMKDNIGRTALFVAAYYSRAECIDLLIQYNANIDARSNDMSTAMCESAKTGKVNCLKILIENGAQVNVVKSNDCLALLCAIHSNKPESLALMIEYNANIEYRDKYNWTPIIYASMGYVDCLRILIQNKANIEHQDSNGRTPLICTALYGYVECLKLLIKNKANLETKDNQEKTALMHAIELKYSESIKILLENGAKYPSSEK